MTIIKIIVAAWCLSVCLADLHTRRIPNILTLGACTIAASYLLITGHTLLGADWKSAVLGVIVSQVLTLPAYCLNLLGAGDVKLLLAIALIGGWYLTLIAFVFASILALLFALTRTLFIQFYSYQNESKKWIPFGAAFCAGLLCTIGVSK